MNLLIISRPAVLLACFLPALAQGQVTAELNLRATPAGRCPAVVEFAGRITLSQKGKVRYRFVRSDGYVGTVETLHFEDNGAHPLQATWSVSQPAAGHVYVEILEPVRIQSKPAYFSVACTPVPTGAMPEKATFYVEPAVTPRSATYPGPRGPRPLAAVRDRFGQQADFVANELIVFPQTSQQLREILLRLNGEVLEQVKSTFAGLQPFYLIRVNPGAADPAMIGEYLREIDPLSHGKHLATSDAALRLIAASAQEMAKHKTVVALNWTLQPQDFLSRSTMEAPVGPSGFSANAYNLPYITSGSIQNIGVGEAWRRLALRGLLNNRVRIAVRDTGFAARDGVDDYPAISNLPAFAIGRHPVFGWHGTAVADAAMAVPDNQRGAAGPGGPVAIADLSLMPMDFESMLRAIATAFPAGTQGPRILNLSARAIVPAVPAIFAGEAANLLIFVK